MITKKEQKEYRQYRDEHIDKKWIFGPSITNDKYNWAFYFGFLSVSIWRMKKRTKK